MSNKTDDIVQIQKENADFKNRLLRSNLRFHNLVEKGLVGFLVMDMEGKIIYLNPIAQKFYGSNIGKYLGEESGIPAKEGHMPEFKITSNRNQDVIVEVLVSLIEWEEEPAYLAHLNDITDRILAEKKVTERTNEIEEKANKLEKSEKALIYLLEDVNEIRNNLEKANIKLKELDQLKSMFIASMSHELRTPLNSIIGFTGIILQGIDGEINPQQNDHLGRANRSAKHLLALINDIIDLSKVEAGKVDVFVDDIALDEVINEAVDSVRLQANEKGLALDVSVPQGVRMNTDRKRLYQCILNYLSNAVKFTESGTVSITANDTNEEVEVIVSDTGIGISTEDQQRLFKPFVRIDSHLRAKTLGTGLGLYLTRKLTTELLGGTVEVQSQPGQGSEFTLRLPKELKKD